MKYLNLLESVQKNVLTRLGWRCPLVFGGYSLPSVASLLRRYDVNALKQFQLAGMVDYFFNVTQNNLRSRCSFRPKDTTRSARINNVFAWRVSKQFNGKWFLLALLRIPAVQWLVVESAMSSDCWAVLSSHRVTVVSMSLFWPPFLYVNNGVYNINNSTSLWAGPCL